MLVGRWMLVLSLFAACGRVGYVPVRDRDASARDVADVVALSDSAGHDTRTPGDESLDLDSAVDVPASDSGLLDVRGLDAARADASSLVDAEQDATDARISDTAVLDTAVIDTGAATDATIIDGTLVPPRPIAPLSTATVTSRRPALRWENAPGILGARVEVCRDRACTMVIETLDAADASGGAPLTRALPSRDLPQGVVFWRLRALEVSPARVSALTSPVWQFTVGAGSSAPIDSSWGTTSDFNGDGYADVIVGASQQSGGAPNEGLAYVYYGSATGVPTAPSLTLDNPLNQANGRFGYSVASAGDVNGDGYADLIVGARGQTSGAASGGVGYIYYGSASGVPTTPSFALESPLSQAFGQFGHSVASAGDVNGDGYADVIVGAPSHNASASFEGRAYVYHGSASGVPTAPAVALESPLNQANAQFGNSVASAGDVNGDGYADVIVGANGQDVGAGDAGVTYLYYGSMSGVPTTPTVTLGNPVPQGGAAFGYSVAGAGDVNGDGYADVVVGAPFQNAGATFEGLAFIYDGSSIGLPTTPSVTLDNPLNQANGRFGWSVAGAGDVNGDGRADLIVGTFGQDAGAMDEGLAYLYYGRASGVGTTPSVTFDNPLNEADSWFGTCVASAGDLNGDGYADITIGAYNGGPVNEGTAYVYVGAASGPAPSVTLSNPLAQASGEFGFSIAHASPPSARGRARSTTAQRGPDEPVGATQS